jgi:hypothetical protein
MQMSKSRQESIARAEMIYREIVLVQHLIVLCTVSILIHLNKAESIVGTVLDYCFLAGFLFATYIANRNAVDARSKWKELTE